MAMSGDGLAAAIIVEVEKAIIDGGANQEVFDDTYLKVFCNAFVAYLVANQQLVGVTAGTASAQTITTASSSVI